ncbi:surfeit locus protein 4 homolog [Drosophila montana]|uniref:surfeit locus protein 4 homolog n=1 Tax=Drosophila montana TaxID=40370 RepID=UPI00313DB215
MEPLPMELKDALATLARFFIICNFLADSVHLLHDWDLERTLLNLNWRCGEVYANLYLSCIVAGQLLACFMVIFDSNRQVAAGILSLLANLRVASNPMFWNMEMYADVFALVIAILLATIPPHRLVRCGFLFVAYLTYKNLNDGLPWQLLHRYGVKLLIIFVLSGYRLKWSTAMLLLLLATQSFQAYAWWELPYSLSNMPIIFYKRFQFWQMVSILGGVLMTAVHTQEF